MKLRACVGLLCVVLASCRSAGGGSSGTAAGVPAAPPDAPDAIDAGGNAAVVVIEKTAILVGGQKVVALPPLAEAGETGVEAQYKRKGTTDLYVVPLGEALLRARTADKAAHGEDVNSSALIVADPTTPYRVLIEVLFTLGQSEFGRYHLLALGEKRTPRETVPPSITKWEAQRKKGAPPKSLNLSVFVVRDGIMVKTAAGNVAPGCAGEGKGLTVPRVAAGHDLDALAACAARLKGAQASFAEETQVTLTANPSVDFATVLAVMDALRVREGKELFPDVHFGVAR